MAYELFYLLVTTITATFSFVLSVIMTSTFFRKRTLGSAFMMIAFGMISVGEIFNTFALWLSYLRPIESSFTAKILQILYINFVGLSILYFYYFSTRNVLRDNDVTKSIVIIIMAEMIATVMVSMFSENMPGANLAFEMSENLFLGGSSLTILVPTIFLLLGLFVPLLTFVLLRMIITLITIRKKITDTVANRGLLFITLSVIGLTLSTTAMVISYIPAVNNISGLAIFLQIIRMISTMLVMVFGYLGWILPDWLKKRIRGKAWIVQEYKKIITKPITVAYSSSATSFRKESTTQIREISDT
ncbi:MAG: hypothetical protein JXA54_01645 [Candidatus Heimdallarchaeota archaeon]|nr:hypothetical protein [Candidatus Heimdallarchaeota archaeon]